MNKTKKWITLMLATSTVLGGCGVQESADIPIETFSKNGGQLSVKYMESVKDMPYEEDEEKLLSLDKDKNGNLHLISVDQKFSYHDYEMNPLTEEALVYESKEISWLHELVPDYNSWIIDVRMDTENSPIACMVNADGQWMIAREGENIPLEDCPGGIAITADGQVVLPYNRTGIIADWEGNEVFHFDKGLSPSTVSQATDTYQAYIACKNTQEDAVVVYDYKEKTRIAEIPYVFNKDEDVVIRFDEQNNIYIADGKGIHKASITEKSFTTLVDSKSATIGMTTSGIMGMEIDGKGNIWCVVQDYNTGKTDLFCYSYTKLEGTEKTLTLYTMKESDWLKKLTIDFQNAYPQYVIQMVVDGDKTTTVQDKLRNLHAQLLSGSGPDILMLDGLPVEAYADKGILADITECVEHSDVIEGVKNTVKSQNGTFAVATRMGIPVMLDNQGEAELLEQIESLKQALQKKEILLPSVEADALAELFAVVYYDELFTAERNLSENNLASLIEVMGLMKENGYVAEINEYAQTFMEEYGARFGLTCLPTFKWNAGMAYELAVDEANVAIQECNCISMDVLGIASHLNKNMSVMNNMYFPYGQLGVNSASACLNESKQFISFALSEAEQSIYLEDGIPVTYTGLESLKKVQNPNVEMGMTLPDGSELELRWPTETEISSFVELCEKVDKKQQFEQVIVQLLKEQFQKYLTGEASADEISENVKNQIKTYLEEQE